MYAAGHVSKAASLVYQCAADRPPALTGTEARDGLLRLHPDRHPFSPRNLMDVMVSFPRLADTDDPAVADVDEAEPTAGPEGDDAHTGLFAMRVHELLSSSEVVTATPRCDAFFASDDKILRSLQTMARGTAPGPFGPSADLLRCLIRRQEHEPALLGLNALCCCLARDIAYGRVPASVYRAVSESLLVAIGKAGGGTRPIAMADTWCKWAFRCLQTAIQPDIDRMLPDHQVGVMVPGGAEAAVLLHKIALEVQPAHVTCITDASNAFNRVSRESVLQATAARCPELFTAAAHSLCTPSPLWLSASSHPHTTHVEDWYLLSTEGVRQGDSASPLLFSLVMEDILHEVEQQRIAMDRVGFILAFLDDGSIRAPYTVLCRLLPTIVNAFAKRGLMLNPAKFVIFETPEAKVLIDELLRQRPGEPRYPLGLTPTKEGGYRFLGAPIGSSDFIKEFVSKAVANMHNEARALVVLGTEMHLPRHAVTLLRDSFAHRLRHLARTTPPDIMEPALRAFDDLVAQTLLDILGEGGDAIARADYLHVGELFRQSKARIFRSAPKGGMAIRSTADTAQAAYTAGCLQAIPVIARIARTTPGTFPDVLTPERLASITKDEVAELCAVAPCLAPAISAERWADWSELLRHARPDRVSHSLGQQGVLSGAMPAAPGAAGVDAARRPTHLDFITLPPERVLQLAAARALPPRLQHVLSTVQEGARDAETDLAILNPGRESLRAARDAWGSPDPLSRHLYALQVHACSGDGHAWVLDTGRRSDQFGRPRKGSLHLQADGPLEEYLYRIACRARLLLPMGHLIREAQRHGGYDAETWPLCHCHSCRGRGTDGRAKHLDLLGLHLGTRVADGGYTPRHHSFNEAFTKLIRAAGYSASIEKNPFKDNKDRVATQPATSGVRTSAGDVVARDAIADSDDEVSSPDAESEDDDDDLDDAPDDADDAATAPPSSPRPSKRAHARKSRLDTIIRDVPLIELRTILPAAMLSHLDDRTDTHVDVLVDYTFTHPGAFLGFARASKREDFTDPDAAGNRAVKFKNDKYLAKAIQHKQVLLPFHVSAYGRIHPVAFAFMQHICSKVAASKLHSPNVSAFPQSDPLTRQTLLTRSYMRNLSTSVQRSFALGLLQAARRVVCPRQEATQLRSLVVSPSSLGNDPLRSVNSPTV